MLVVFTMGLLIGGILSLVGVMFGIGIGMDLDGEDDK